MATEQKTSPKKPNKTEQKLLEQLLAELDTETGSKNGAGQQLTKSQALIKHMVDDALSGDPKMLGHMLKLMEKMNIKESDGAEISELQSVAEWESLFAFYGKYGKLIGKEITRLKKINPTYWSFKWFTPTLKEAPWYGVVHAKEHRKHNNASA